MGDTDTILERLDAAWERSMRPENPHDRFGPPPWTAAHAAAWELTHGHDIRLRCRKVEDCQYLMRAHLEIVDAWPETRQHIAEQDAHIKRLEAVVASAREARRRLERAGYPKQLIENGAEAMALLDDALAALDQQTQQETP